MDGAERCRRLRWQCRRGMKELDVLLQAFLDREQGSLAQGNWPELEALLSHEDDEVWDWLLDPSAPAAHAYRGLLHAILDET